MSAFERSHPSSPSEAARGDAHRGGSPVALRLRGLSALVGRVNAVLVGLGEAGLGEHLVETLTLDRACHGDHFLSGIGGMALYIVSYFFM